MKIEKTIGSLLISGSILVLIPYTILTGIFDYPAILRQETGVILTKFHEGGAPLIWTWWAFALVGLPLLGAYIFLGQKLENRFSWVRLATFIGIVGLVVQMIGLLRWPLVVPILAQQFADGNPATQAAAKIAFQVIHQYGGVGLGEHLGQLFTIAWTVMMTAAFAKTALFPKWLIGLGYLSSGIYFMAQAELVATVISSFPYWDLAGFLGSTLWLIWLIALGIRIFRVKL